MISKFFRSVVQFPKKILLKHRVNVSPLVLSRTAGALIPPSQYDTPLSKKFHLMYVLATYWEIIPLFITTLTSLSFMTLSIIWAFNNKVDTVYTTHNRRNISRTMDLRNPTVHKIVIINQRYEPWPEMQDVLDKMVAAEKRAEVRTQSCSYA